jgi:hypothetical protein
MPGLLRWPPCQLEYSGSACLYMQDSFYNKPNMRHRPLGRSNIHQQDVWSTMDANMCQARFLNIRVLAARPFRCTEYARGSPHISIGEPNMIHRSLGGSNIR